MAEVPAWFLYASTALMALVALALIAVLVVFARLLAALTRLTEDARRAGARAAETVAGVRRAAEFFLGFFIR